MRKPDKSKMDSDMNEVAACLVFYIAGSVMLANLIHWVFFALTAFLAAGQKHR